MSQSEDYLDGLLNSINKAKTDVAQVQENAEKKQQDLFNSRSKISPDEDFLTASGIDVSEIKKTTSHPNLRKAFSEDDFLREFEEELMSDKANSVIDAFELEIDEEEINFQETGEMPEYNNIVNSLLDNINNAVSDAQEESSDIMDNDNSIAPSENAPSDDINVGVDSLDDDLMSLFNDYGSEEENDSDIGLDSDNIEAPIGNDNTENEDSDDSFDLGFDLDSEGDLELNLEDDSSNDVMSEFEPDEMDAIDAAEYNSDGDLDLSGDDLGLEDLLSDGDDDLLDIQSLLESDDDQFDIDEAVEEESEESSDKKKKKKKEKGEKTKNPFFEKLKLIIFGPDDEEEEPEKPVEVPIDTSMMSEEELAVLSNLEGDLSTEEPKGKKKKEKKEKPKKEPKPKKEKPKKAPKPKKEKKPKAPDNSPKIPISVIAVFLSLSISIIGIVLIGMNYMGIQRHMNKAEEDFKQGNYISAYEKLNGLNLKSEDDVLMRNQSRTLADLQQCQNEYEAFISNELYDFALDSLIKGIGRYNKYKDDAEEYNISEPYNQYGQMLIDEASSTFGISEQEALDVFNQKNRHYYTIELRKILIRLGYENNDSDT